MPVTTNVFEIILQNTLTETSFTKNVWNVFHYRLSSGTPDTAANILSAWVSAVQNPLRTNWLTTDCACVGVLGRFLDDATVQYATNLPGTSGLIALPRLPGDLALVLPLRGSNRGKNYRGSKHIPAIASAFVTKDELNATGITAAALVQGYLGLTITSTNSSTYIPVILSRNLSQLRTNPTTIVTSDVSAVLVNKTIGTMRRRKEKTVR